MEFEFEKWALGVHDLHEEETHFFIENFLVETAITMFYGKEKQGKSWLMYAITRMLCESDRIKKVFYIDQDNPKRQLKERGIDALIATHKEKLKYMAKGSTPVQGIELAEALAKPARMDAYKGCVFIYDSTRDFVRNTDSDIQSKQFMDTVKEIREAGGTVILVHHATKSGKVIDGSSEFTKSADNVYEVVQRGKDGEWIQYTLPVYRDRDAIKDMTVSVNTITLELRIDGEQFQGIKKDDEPFIKDVVALLAKNPSGTNQSAILTTLGYRRDDKTRNKILSEYTDRFWRVEMVRKSKIFYIMEGA